MSARPSVTTVEVKRPKIGEEVQIVCRLCQQPTCHQVRTKVIWTDEVKEDGWWETATCLTVSCRGCKAVSFVEICSHAESDGDDDAVVYPPRLAGQPPLTHRHYLPPHVRAIYDETHASLCGARPILAGIGIRTIVEAVCSHQSARGRVLKEQIDSLESMGCITKSGATILHNLRFMGNKAAHEVKAHTQEELGIALEVVEYLLQGVYILPKIAVSLPQEPNPH
jgi:hypothetical protein